MPQFVTSPIPEPSALAMLGLVGLLGLSRRGGEGT
ncbi:MAG: PEP-CTERM sorting domain-containing protein [Akkermansiaceae bacterium]|nr:PEP-CTERM sorting domain-containing protein [Akkermansiaceae bacterium]